MSACSLQYTVCSCEEYICSTVKLSQFLQYLTKHAFQSSSCLTILKDQQSGLDMEIWLTPIRTSTYERPFTQKGNYLVCISIVFDWYFVHVLLFMFCLCFMYKFSSPVKPVYWFNIVPFSSHIIFPHLCGLLNLIFMNTVHWHGSSCGQWSALCVVYSGQCYVLCIVSLTWLAISRQRFGTDQIWQRYIGETMIPHSAEENHEDDRLKSTFWQGLVEV